MSNPHSNDQTLPTSQAPTASAPGVVPVTPRSLAHLARGAVISRYRVESVLGEGGMGVVYLARQEKPDREVALKVVRPAYATEKMLRRFEHESEVLGRLLHPGIAQIYEAGTADAGFGPQPFFAMELVRGVSLTRFAGEKKLSTRERLELMARVCDAVQHAHQKGVIHRDLKPGNILVTEDGQPKILDFGIARATDSDIQQTTMQTDVGVIVGTLPYMSPEQVGADPAELDTRSDVYALGVILYELLAGRLPYSLDSRMLHEAVRIIREEEPARLSSIDRTLRGDVETIVGHAMEKDKTRRYGAANSLATDIRCYLSDEPITARPASTWYQLQKFSRRHKALVGGVLTSFLILLAGLAATAWQARETRREADRADERAIAAKAAEIEQQRLAALAERKATEAEAAVRTIEYNSYVANIQMARGWMDLRYFDRARSQLDACPVRLRGWEWGWLNASSDYSLLTLKNDSGYVTCASFCPNGKWIVTASSDGIVHAWDAATGRSLAELKGHTAPVRAACFSPDGKHLITAAEEPDFIVRLWDTSTWTTIAELSDHRGRVCPPSFSSDGTRVVTAFGSTARVWDAASGTKLAELHRNGGQILFNSFSPDGTQLLTVTAENTASTWDTATWTIAAENKGPPERVDCAWFGVDGPRIITTKGDKNGQGSTRRVWDAATGRLVAEDHQPDRGTFLSFSHPDPKGRLIVTSQGGNPHVWDATTGARLSEFKRQAGPDGGACFSADGAMIVTTHVDGTACVWSSKTGTCYAEFIGPVGSVGSGAFSPDGQRVVTTGKEAHVWNARMGQDPANAERPMSVGIRNRGRFAFSKDHQRIVTVLGHAAEVWEAASGKRISNLTSDPASNGSGQLLTSALLSPDGDRVATVSEDTVRVWSATTGKTLLELGARRTQGFTTAAFSADGARLLTGSHSGGARIWDAVTGTSIAELEGHSDDVMYAAFSPDGGRLVTASADATARIWDTSAWTTIVVLEGHKDEVRYIEVSADGRRIATCSVDGSARVWDAATGSFLFDVKGHEGIVESATFNHDATRLVTVWSDGDAVVSDAATGAEFVRLSPKDHRVVSAWFSEDGSQIITADSHAETHVWDSVPYRERFAARGASLGLQR